MIAFFRSVVTISTTGIIACSTASQDLGDTNPHPDAGTSNAADASSDATQTQTASDAGGGGDIYDSPAPPDGWDDFHADAVATSESTPPWGIWTMSVQYGPVGVPTTPIVPMQIEMRSDGTAFRWTCVGAPADGSLTAPCVTQARTDCLTGTNAWEENRWHVAFPANDSPGLQAGGQGDLAPDGEGHILITYIDPSYSGALFRKVADPTSGGAACVPSSQ